MVPRRTNTRERLIRAAAELFWRQGYGQTGVNEIIQQAGSTSGSFYHFFPAKEDLALAVVDHVEEFFEREIFDPAISSTGDPIERVLAVLETYRAKLFDNRFKLGSPMAVLAAEMSEGYPRVRTRISELFSAWTARIEALLDQAGGRLPRSFDRKALASMIVSTMEGAVLRARVDRGLEPFDAVIHHLRAYLYGFEGGPDSPQVVPTTSSRPIPKPASVAADWKAW